jgi:Carboxypeptidase regulatory-like domain
MALCFCVCPAAFAQTDVPALRSPRSLHVETHSAGALSGRLTDLHSAPLAGISLILRNQQTGEELRAITLKSGAFYFASLPAGTYALDADEPQLGHGHLEGIVVSGGIESRVQAAVRFQLAPLVSASSTSNAIEPASSTGQPTPQLRAAVPQTSVLARPGAPSTTNLPAPARATPTPSHPSPEVISEPSPAVIASAAADSSRTLPLHTTPAPGPQRNTSQASRGPNIPEQPPIGISIQPPGAAPPAPHQRAALETESDSIEPSVALVLPRPFALASPTDASSLLMAAATAAIQSAMLHNPARLGPAFTAAEKPDPESPPVTATIAAEQMQSLPVGGRRWQEFILDTPAASATSSAEQPSFRDAGEQSAEITVDGASMRLAFGIAAGSSAGMQASDPSIQDQSSMSQSFTAGRGFGVSESAIREVTATAGNAEVESMRAPGGQTSIRTQGGSDALHGQGFFFDKQNTWGARNPFTQWVQNLGSAAAPDFTPVPFTPPDHEVVWGLGAGSRIRRDKLFWFAALDSYRRNDPGDSSVRNPAEFFDLPEPTSPDVALLSAQLGESQSQAYNDFLGVAAPGYAPAGLEQLAALLGPAPRTAAQWLGFGRIDWQIAERHRLTVEATGAYWNAPGGGVTRVSETYGSHSYGSSRASQEWLLARWEAYLTPNLLAVTQVSAGRDILFDPPESPSAFEQAFLNGNVWGQLPQIVVDSRYGFTIGNPARFGQGSYPDEKLLHAQEMVDWVHGRWLVKAGFELDHNADATHMLRNQTGTYSYAKVANFISDALAFQKFGLADALDPVNPHNCGVTSAKFGSQPCYSSYSQTMGPTFWHLSTNDWAGFTTAQWQASRFAVFSAGMRWELEQMPPPIAWLANSQLTQTEKLPSLGSDWGPRVSLAIGNAGGRWPVLRFGYGMYYGRTENATIETALTQTGSLRGDLNFFMRPSDDCQFCSGGAPPFPYVFAGQPASVVKPGAVEFAPDFKTPEVHQAVAAIEQSLPGRVQLTASGLLSLGRRLPISIDTNLDTPSAAQTITYAVDDPTGKGPIKSTQIVVPFYASWPGSSAACPYYQPMSTPLPGRPCPDYQQITEITSRANSTYEAAMVKIAREGRHGLSLHAHYTYAHAMDWNPNESAQVSGNDVLDPADFADEYGTSNLDVRHSAALIAVYETPWKLRGFAGRVGDGWMISGIGQFRTGLPYTMRTTGSLPELFTTSGAAIVGLGPGINGSGGDNRIYGAGNDGVSYNIGRNTFRYPDTWKADLRLGKRFNLGETRQLEILAESFNLFNHQNVTAIETNGYSIESGGATGLLPTLCYLTINTETGGATCASSTTLTGTGIPLPAFGQPLDINATNFYRERQIQLGLRMRF